MTHPSVSLNAYQIFGVPYHGKVKAGRLLLPSSVEVTSVNGEYRLPDGKECFWWPEEDAYYIPYPQPSGSFSVVDQRLMWYGTNFHQKKPGIPDVVRTADQLQADTSSGKQWRSDFAVAGMSFDIHGQSVGGFVYFASDGTRWTIKVGGASLQGDTLSVTCTVTRFGEFRSTGPEEPNVYDVELPNAGLTTPVVERFTAGGSNTTVSRVEVSDVKSDGSQAILRVVGNYQADLGFLPGFGDPVQGRPIGFVFLSVSTVAGEVSLSLSTLYDRETTLGAYTAQRVDSGYHVFLDVQWNGEGIRSLATVASITEERQLSNRILQVVYVDGVPTPLTVSYSFSGQLSNQGASEVFPREGVYPAWTASVTGSGSNTTTITWQWGSASYSVTDTSSETYTYSESVTEGPDQEDITSVNIHKQITTNYEGFTDEVVIEETRTTLPEQAIRSSSWGNSSFGVYYGSPDLEDSTGRDRYFGDVRASGMQITSDVMSGTTPYAFELRRALCFASNRIAQIVFIQMNLSPESYDASIVAALLPNQLIEEEPVVQTGVTAATLHAYGSRDPFTGTVVWKSPDPVAFV